MPDHWIKATKFIQISKLYLIKNKNAENDLRSAVLAGAYLERCNLSGSDLNEMNLSGANFKDTLFESIQSPLSLWPKLPKFVRKDKWRD